MDKASNFRSRLRFKEGNGESGGCYGDSGDGDGCCCCCCCLWEKKKMVVVLPIEVEEATAPVLVLMVHNGDQLS